LGLGFGYTGDLYYGGCSYLRQFLINAKILDERERERERELRLARGFGAGSVDIYYVFYFECFFPM
jgi:hypothetical protein